MCVQTGVQQLGRTVKDVHRLPLSTYRFIVEHAQYFEVQQVLQESTEVILK